MSRLQGQVALVTGASSGIGRATALRLAKAGALVFIGARRLPLLEAIATEGQGRGLRLVPLALDVTDGNSLAAAAARIRQATNGYDLDILVNNAGFGQMGPVEELPIEWLRQQLETNLIGAIALTQLFLPAMRRRRYGRVVNVSSLAGRTAFPFGGAYAASKFALEGISDALRWELAPWGVRVVLIEPGPIATDFGKVVEQRLASPADGPTAYPLGYQIMQRWDESTRKTGLPPDLVAKAIERACASPRPAARYVVPGLARPLVGLVRLLPDRLVDGVLGLAQRYYQRESSQVGRPPSSTTAATPSASSQLR